MCSFAASTAANLIQLQRVMTGKLSLRLWPAYGLNQQIPTSIARWPNSLIILSPG
jgi:hypothetical protein